MQAASDLSSSSEMRSQRLCVRPRRQLGQENLRPARDTDNCRVCARRQRLGWHLSWAPQGPQPDLRRQGRSWLRQDVGHRAAQTADAADPQNPALCEADCTRPSGSSRSCWRRLNTGPSPPRGRCGTRSSKVCVKIYDCALLRLMVPPPSWVRFFIAPCAHRSLAPAGAGLFA